MLSSLNPAQRAAVEYIEGPQLIVAGAGSGKTRVLTYKIAYLLQQGYRPWEILALTFTNKAAREMNERIERIVGEGSLRALWSGTFHSIFARLLRIEHVALGISQNFTIYDEQDSRTLLKNVAQDLGLDEKVYKPAEVHHRISDAKNHLMTPEDYAGDAERRRHDQQQGKPAIAQIYTAYQARLRGAEAMDFDDLLMQTYYLLYRNEEVRTRWQQRFRYVLVDEYQDTNMAQHRILRLLVSPQHEHLCVVGDDAQSIYAFRGAEIQGILSFERQYAGAKVMKLERNYRSTQTIVDAASSLIRHNRGQIPKNVYSEAEQGDKIRLIQAYTDKEEAQKVVREIRRAMRLDPSLTYDDVAVLYRTNAQSRSLEEALKTEHLPYRIFGGLSFYQRREIKDVIAYFRLVVNHADSEALRRIINYPARKIGATTLERLHHHALALNAEAPDFWLSLQRVDEVPDLNRPTRQRLTEFRMLIEGFAARLETTSAYALARAIIEESGVAKDLFADKTPEGIARQQNVDELLSTIHTYEEEQRKATGRTLIPLTEYLSQVALLTDADAAVADGSEQEGLRPQPHITLTTCHGAKGLEFAVVVVSGMEQEIFPSSQSAYNNKELEEERRLCYVAMTRAKRFLTFTYATSRFRYGQMQFSDVSQFVREIDARYIEGVGARETAPSLRTYDSPREHLRPHTPTAANHGKPSAASQPLSPYKSVSDASTPHTPHATFKGGQRVSHQKFGEGKILEIMDAGENQKVRVQFEGAGEKVLLLRFARLMAVE